MARLLSRGSIHLGHSHRELLREVLLEVAVETNLAGEAVSMILAGEVEAGGVGGLLMALLVKLGPKELLVVE